MGSQGSAHPEIASSLYRRLPMEWWVSARRKGRLNLLPVSRFMPNSRDADGLSVSQAGISSIEVASTSARGKRLCLAEFAREAATDRGLTVEPKPTSKDPGHAVIPQMNYAAREADEAIVAEHAAALASASQVVWPPLNYEPDEV